MVIQKPTTTREPASSEKLKINTLDPLDEEKELRENPRDKEKTSFITNERTYYYKAMLFVLRNARATYQKVMNALFKDQIDRNMEVFVDDMLVKSLKAPSHIIDLNEAFAILRRNSMSFNLTKCAFGLTRGNVLGFMVT